ncbi:hypothetical protein [Providencia sp. wls1914]|uniref:hypothetical protein n=1 Tax=Providencia sp. wls1914 TaxID=2675156 RepID=UPI0012B61F67|nr:hypothetical protein [Providencia sp. wls1914]MTC72304.1 hypothetical protein [Providencia sp. wls1914]
MMITTCNRCAGHVIEVRQQANEPEDSRYTSDNSQGGGAGQIPTTLALKYRRLTFCYIAAG